MELIALFSTIALFQVLAAASPGPNFVLVSSSAATKSLRYALLASVGIVVGVIIWSILAAIGLGALIATHPNLHHLVQYLGAAYLVWLGIKMIRSGLRNACSNVEIGPGRSHHSSSAILKGFLINIGNPKTVAYYTSLFAVLLPADAPSWVIGGAVAVDAFACAAWLSFIALLFATGSVRRFFDATRRYVDMLMGGALILLGIKLATDQD